MRRTLSRLWSTIALAGAAALMGNSQVQAQPGNPSRSLGGYGATSTSPMAGMGSGSPTIPYAGSFGGFMPYRMASGAGDGLSFSSRGNSVIESSRTSFSLAPMSGGMGAGMAPRAGSLDAFRSQGVIGLGGARLMNQPMGVGNRSSVMPPNFGYPFYQPPSLLSPTFATGMSM